MVKIRTISADEIDLVCEIEKATYGVAWSRAQFVEELSHPLSRIWGLWDETTLCAYLCIRSVVDQAEVLNIGTHPTARRRGYAKALLAYAIETLPSAGCKMLDLEVRSSNLPAQALYLSLGFQPIALRAAYYSPISAGSPREDARIMRKCLLPCPELKSTQ